MVAVLVAAPPSEELAIALDGDAQARATALASLRQRGPSAMDEIATLRNDLQAQLAQQNDKAAYDALQSRITALNELMDQVGGAKYCSASQLYWYTDFAQAQAAAADQHKPILCLRMMGKLDEEFSCANSRFFRTTLYANAEISKTLRDSFILHWGSVRPVPKVTIDFGDGRKLERTLTGNSAHYVVAADGRVLDGLPGLYGPQAFAAWLGRVQIPPNRPRKGMTPTATPSSSSTTPRVSPRSTRPGLSTSSN
jgi:hypothetical protein